MLYIPFFFILLELRTVIVVLSLIVKEIYSHFILSVYMRHFFFDKLRYTTDIDDQNKMINRVQVLSVLIKVDKIRD